MRYNKNVISFLPLSTKRVFLSPLGLTLFIVLMLYPLAAAQTFTVGTRTLHLQGFGPDIRFEGVKALGLTFGFRASGDVEGRRLELGATTRFNTSLGPLGNVAVTGAADADSAGSIRRFCQR